MYWRVIMKYKLPHAPARHMDKNAFFLHILSSDKILFTLSWSVIILIVQGSRIEYTTSSISFPNTEGQVHIFCYYILYHPADIFDVLLT